MRNRRIAIINSFLKRRATRRKFLINNRGVATIEFVLTIFWYFFIVFLILECARVTLSVAYWDLALSEATRISKNQQATNTEFGMHDYKTLFEKTLRERQKTYRDLSLGLFAIKENSFKVDVKYADTIDDLLNSKFREPKKDLSGKIIAPVSGAKAAIALYSFTYDYTFLVPLPFIPKSWINPLYNRKIVAVQEYERN